MEWKKFYLDLILVPLALLSVLLYHCWLWHTVRTWPGRTNVGINNTAQRVWLAAMLKDNDKKNILAVQTLRNNLMGSSLMATTSILICVGLLTFTSRAFSVDRPNVVTEYDPKGEVSMDTKCAILLSGFVSSFFCQCLSIVSLNQVHILTNILIMEECTVTRRYVSKLLEKGLFFSTVGNRLFFATLPLLVWIYGPIPVLLGEAGLVAVLYTVDVEEDRADGVAVTRVTDVGQLV